MLMAVISVKAANNSKLVSYLGKFQQTVMI